MSDGVALIPPAVLRNLSDRSSEKRKSSIQEIDKAIRKMGEGDVRSVLLLLANDFTLSVNNNSRKGGLLALAQCAIALGQSQISRNLPLVIPPVLKNFSDQDARVRFYACESLFNICKMCRCVWGVGGGWMGVGLGDWMGLSFSPSAARVPLSSYLSLLLPTLLSVHPLFFVPSFAFFAFCAPLLFPPSPLFLLPRQCRHLAPPG